MPQNPPPSETNMLTGGDVARVLKCSRQSIYRMRDQGRIPPPVRLGRLMRWRRALLEQWIADGCPIPQTACSPPG